MRVLVFGCGVIGALTAHTLARAGHDVIVLARGPWKETLESDGLRIRHWAQLRTTVDRLRVIDSLAPNDRYDLLLVAMQWTQLGSVVPVVAANASPTVLFIGNNPEGEKALEAMKAGGPGRSVLFGFQLTAGRREANRVVSIHWGLPLVVGPLRGQCDPAVRPLVESAFRGAGCRLTWEPNMDAWLKQHLAQIIPVVHLCWSTGYRLTRATWKDIGRVLEAVSEGYQMLRRCGVRMGPASPVGGRTGWRRRALHALAWGLVKTPIGALMASDHCEHAPEEMVAIDRFFEGVRRRSGMPGEAWEVLRSRALASPSYPIGSENAEERPARA
ncbi:ketopantoate reductase family protein [Schaalia sp. 19OD2882]|uniref:ketopantoate reductase family protein n=1 Tax=Schaalia sp. 19OD2882 TaxID=2794089 RepID=UPI001C1F08D2|nr:2-dehydropantoate 2-reductase N-terminal domain-containing protein [Schaalia sp. 19OD2882]QWW19542.1 ketopantoate reductase family protein [Schaalia sp. 19OD2882]